MIINVTNGDAAGVAYWKAERFVVKWTTAEEVIFAYQNGAETVDIATYQTANGGVLIDVTNFVRAYQERNTLIFSDGTNTRTVTFNVAGLINPAGVLIPEHDGEDYLHIVAPSVLYRSAQFPPAIIETRPKAGVTGLMLSEFDGEDWNGGTLDLPSDNLDAGTISFEISKSGLPTISRVLQETYCERIYACVEWVSFTGATRRHVFEIAKAEVETGEVVNLANILNEWTEIKGRVDGFTLRLENLDRYDLWYYSDLITSSRVRVTIDGTNWYDVHVDENAYTLPESNAGRLSTLEIPVKFRKYDAVSL